MGEKSMKKLVLMTISCAFMFETQTTFEKALQLASQATRAVARYQRPASALDKVHQHPITSFVRAMKDLQNAQQEVNRTSGELVKALQEAASAYRQQASSTNRYNEQLKNTRTAHESAQKAIRWALNATAGVVGFLTAKNTLKNSK
jgi:hypothetical protein